MQACIIKGSMALLADRNPEEARQFLDPALERLMAPVMQSLNEN